MAIFLVLLFILTFLTGYEWPRYRKDTGCRYCIKSHDREDHERLLEEDAANTDE